MIHRVLNALSRLMEDGIYIVSSYIVLLLVTWLLFIRVDDLIIPILFSFIPKLCQNNSRVASAIKISKIFLHNSRKPNLKHTTCIDVHTQYGSVTAASYALCSYR